MSRAAIQSAWRLARAGDVDGGVTMLRDAAPDPAKDAGAKCYYQRALILLGAHRWEDAARTMESWLEHHAGDAAALTLHGQTLVNLGRWEAASDTLTRALEIEPQNLIANNYLALARFGAGRYDDARDIWRRVGLHLNRAFLATFARIVEKRVEESPDALPPITREYVTAWQMPTARLWAIYKDRRVFGAYLRQRLVKKWMQFAERLLYSGSYAGAREVYGLVDELEPGHQNAQLGRVLALIGEERWADTRALLLGLLGDEVHPYRAFFLTAMAYCEHKVGESERALEILRRCPDAGPEDFGKHYIAGLCHLALGDEAAAQHEFETALTDFFVDTKDQWVDAVFFRIMKKSGEEK